MRLGIAVRHMKSLPTRISRTQGCFVASKNSMLQKAGSVVLIPRDPLEAARLQTAFEGGGHPLSLPPAKEVLETRRPGIFYCDPTQESSVAGGAAAAYVNAWLGRCAEFPGTNVAVVDSHRCRACNTCVEICEFGAPQLIGQEPNLTSAIDPFICMGCGTCAAHCPSGAITAGYSTDAQLERMIQAVLSNGGRRFHKNKVLVFTCNWSAYSGLETAGQEHRCYSPLVYPFKVMCLGRLGPGLILKALERGAAGVIMLGCPQGECRYDFGDQRAEETFAIASSLMQKLGYARKQLIMDRLAVNDGKTLTEKIRKYVAELKGGRVSR